MDRLKEIEVVASTIKSRYLKSSMDRLKVFELYIKYQNLSDLKSSIPI